MGGGIFTYHWKISWYGWDAIARIAIFLADVIIAHSCGMHQSATIWIYVLLTESG